MFVWAFRITLIAFMDQESFFCVSLNNMMIMQKMKNFIFGKNLQNNRNYRLVKKNFDIYTCIHSCAGNVYMYINNI